MHDLEGVDPDCAVCFSGHRPERLPGKGDRNVLEMNLLITALRQRLIVTINQGKTTFLHGCMAGRDIVCAEQIIILKKQHPRIQLISVAPYKAEFFSREKCWTPDWISRAREVFNLHDVGVKVADQYRSGIYYERNRILIEHSTELICYWDGGKGGTAYTIQYAKKKGVVVVNMI